MKQFMFALPLMAMALLPAFAQTDASTTAPQIQSDTVCVSPAPYVEVPVKIGFTVTAAGKVTDMVVLATSGNPAVDRAAMACAKKWTYVAATQDGKPADRQWGAKVLWLPSDDLVEPVPQDNGACNTPDTDVARADPTLRYTIGRDGSVTDVAIVLATGNAAVDAYVTDCMRHWRFTPGLYKGKPVPVTRMFAVYLPRNTIAMVSTQRPPSAASLAPPAQLGRPHVCGKLYYPALAKRLKHEGDTALLFIVETNGTISSPQVTKSSGYDELDEAALQCAMGWTFVPARQNGESVAVPWRGVVRWRLNDME
jgi:TonB family protein